MNAVRDDFITALKHAKENNLPAAMDWYNKILFESPDFTPAWIQRGLALLQMGHPFDAIMNFDRAIDLDAKNYAGYVNRGAAYLDAEYFNKALANFSKAEKLAPTESVIPRDIGNCLYRMNRLDEALTAYRRAVKINHADADAHLGIAFCQLKMGNYEEGWHEFEWRWKNGALPPRGLPYPKWDGERTFNKNDVLLIYGEQGLGDVLQFCRLAPLAKTSWRGKIYIEVPPPLTRIMSTLGVVDGIVTLGEKLPNDIAACIPVMTLPKLLGIKQIEDIPAQVPYLHADPYRVKIWGDLTAKLPPGMLVGLCWAGMRRDANPGLASIDARRSVSLDHFKGMAKINGISWVSLQLGPPREQVKTPPVGMHIGDWGDHFYDFFDTAALIEALDLVITVDTSVAHIAGALGKPVWVLSRYDACWRWLTDRDDSPWYPSLKLFTQTKPHDWSDPLQRMETKLHELRRKWAPKEVAAA